MANNTESNVFGKDAFVKTFREDLDLTVSDATAVYEVAVEAIKNALDEGKVVRLPGIGSMKKTGLAAGPARNPSTGDTIQVGAGSKYSLKSKITREAVAN